MRNKILIFVFVAFILQTKFQLFAQDSTSQSEPNSTLNFILKTEEYERNSKMEKILKHADVDTTNREVVSFENDFRENYLSDDEFIYNRDEGEKTFIARFWERFVRFLKKLLGMGSMEKIPDINLIIIKIISGIIILVALYFVVKLFIHHKGRWLFEKKNESPPLDINNTEQLIKSANFEQLIAEIEKQGDTRQIIRLYYLWLLKELKDKELIVWLPEKTNTDYMAELKNEVLREQFSYLSYLYNYIWYGEFSITDLDYISAKNSFLKYLGKDNSHG